jgi:uncharacterized membrane protein YbhN (UPF0104 family)
MSSVPHPRFSVRDRLPVSRHRQERPDTPRRPDVHPKVAARITQLLLLMVLVASLLIAIPGLRPVVTTIRHINPVWIAAAIALELASCVSFVVLFRMFFDRLSPRDARALAWTEMASGALLPGGGAGGLAIGGWLIHLAGAPTRWIIRRSGGLFFLTSAVNSASVIIAGILLAVGVSHPNGFVLTLLPVVIVVPLTLAVGALPHAALTRHRMAPWLRGISAGVQDAEQTTFQHPSWRLAGAWGYLGFDMAVLWITLKGVGVPISIPALMLAYNIGYLSNILPIPGGIGVLDAGLAGSLLLYGAPAGHVAAAVLIYHTIALWTPGLGGTIAYLSVRSRLAPTKPPAARPPLDSAVPPAHSTEGNLHEPPSTHPDADPLRLGRRAHRRPAPHPLPRTGSPYPSPALRRQVISGHDRRDHQSRR